MYNCSNLTMKYRVRGSQVTALDSVDLKIAEGEMVSIIGPSGSGKSTLLLILGGMLSPTGGEVFFEEKNLYNYSPDFRANIRGRNMGFVFQTFNLVPYLSAVENVMLPLYLNSSDNRLYLNRAKNALERVELGHRLEHKPNELSIGQQQRVALARMMVTEPRIILADEPTGSLDPETGGHILNFLEELNAQGKTVVMVTHDPEAAKRAHRQLRIIEGKMVEDNAQLN